MDARSVELLEALIEILELDDKGELIDQDLLMKMTPEVVEKKECVYLHELVDPELVKRNPCLNDLEVYKELEVLFNELKLLSILEQ